MMEVDDELNPVDIPGLSIDDLLGSLSLNVMKTNIIQQIKGELSPTQDFLNIVVSKFELIIDNTDDQDTIRELKNEIIDWCNELIVDTCEHYNLAFHPMVQDSLWYLEALTTLYHFFVLNKIDNVKDFLIQYTKIHIKDIINMLGISGRAMDVTSIANKRKEFQRDNIPILSNIDSVIDYIRTLPSFDPEEFFTVLGDDDFYNSNMHHYYQDYTVGGAFINQYISSLVDDYSGPESTDIRNTVRLAFSS